jgi:hypothetical protein
MIKSTNIHKHWTILFAIILCFACKEKSSLHSYYLALDEQNEKFALFEIRLSNDSINGSVFWINRKDTSQLKGYLKDSVFIFNSFKNGVDEDFEFTGILRSNKIFLTRRDRNTDSDFEDKFELNSISSKEYQLLIKKTLAPPVLINLKKDTIIDDYLFEVNVKNWNPETMYGNSSIVIKEKESKRITQVIYSGSFNFNRNMSFDYRDLNFDHIKDLIFYTGNNGSYMSQTFDYYIFNPDKNKFIFNKQLTEIGSGMGIEIDTINKRILSFQKSGCCWHQQEGYVFKKDSLILVKKMTIDEMEVVTIEQNINGKWHKTQKKVSEFKIKEGSDIWEIF